MPPSLIGKCGRLHFFPLLFLCESVRAVPFQPNALAYPGLAVGQRARLWEHQQKTHTSARQQQLPQHHATSSLPSVG